MYIDRSLRDYLDDLASKSPAPGGGSASALAASLGAGLMLMTVNYTLGKRGYGDSQPKIEAIAGKLKGYYKDLKGLIDEDIRAYAKLSGTIKSCADDPARKDELYKEAIEPPFLVCELAHHCLVLCKELAVCGNKGLITDVAAAAILLEGAFFSAKFNVYINLAGIKDTDYIAKVHRVLHPLEDRMPKLKEEILELCEEVIDKDKQ